MPSGQHSEPIVETGSDCQLDCQRDPIEASTDCTHGRRASRVRGKATCHRARPGDEQADGGRLEQLLTIVRVLEGYLERRHAIQVLSRRPQRLATGRHDARVRSGTQHRFGHARCCLDHVFAIVQHEQKAFGPERGRHPLGRRAVRQRKLERNGDSYRHQAGVGERRELYRPHPVGEVRQ